jgi:hypothetical protein
MKALGYVIIAGVLAAGVFARSVVEERGHKASQKACKGRLMNNTERIGAALIGPVARVSAGQG